MKLKIVSNGKTREGTRVLNAETGEDSTAGLKIARIEIAIDANEPFVHAWFHLHASEIEIEIETEIEPDANITAD